MTDGTYEYKLPGWVIGGIAAALLLALAAMVWCFGLENHLTAANRDLAAAQKKNDALVQKQEALSARLQATSETLGQSVGMTQKQIDLRTQTLMAAQQAQARAEMLQNARLAAQQAAAEQKLGAVQTNVSTLNTDVTGAKASIADTQSDLASTKAQLQRTIGDAGVMSGLIATNHDQLELLKHKGDRTYYEFTLQKGAKPTAYSSIKLEAKKVDDKHSRYTMIVSADDRNIEKKDKNLDEPVQFYTGKEPVLFEIVVNNISKNQISGYLSTPKGVPVPSTN